MLRLYNSLETKLQVINTTKHNYLTNKVLTLIFVMSKTIKSKQIKNRKLCNKRNIKLSIKIK